MRICDNDEIEFLLMRVGQLPHKSVEQELIRRLIHNSVALDKKVEKLEQELFLLHTRTAKRTGVDTKKVSTHN